MVVTNDGNGTYFRNRSLPSFCLCPCRLGRRPVSYLGGSRISRLASTTASSTTSAPTRSSVVSFAKVTPGQTGSGTSRYARRFPVGGGLLAVWLGAEWESE